MWPKLFRQIQEDPFVVFVCGGRRTGTTLLSAILSSDRRANPLGPEVQILTRILEAYRWGRERFPDFGQYFFGDLDAYRTFFEESATRFIREVSVRISPGGVLILKNPELSKVLLDAADLFPRALFLATVRDPRDQVASELEVQARRAAASGRDPRDEKRDVSRMARSYVAYYPEILELRNRQPHRIRIVPYEDLVERTKDVLADLRSITKLRLTFDPTQVWPRVSPLAALHSTPSSSNLYGQPIDVRSLGRFKRDLAAHEISAVESACSEFMNAFEYAKPKVPLVD